MQTIGYVGLGKMGFNMVLRLLEKGYQVVASDVNAAQVALAASHGATPVGSLSELVSTLSTRRIIWVMVPHQFVDGVLDELLPLLQHDDIVIDGGNSFFEDSVRRYATCKEKGVHFLDAGTSGGPHGARTGACIMVGGDIDVFHFLQTLFTDLAQPEGYTYAGTAGAGHFVKMVHNGIEYGMMQAIAEGFAVMKHSPFQVRLKNVAELFGHGSVIESRLVSWLLSGYHTYGENLEGVSGEVANSGEGAWTVETAKKYNIPTPVIREALNFRIASQGNPSYTGQIVSVMRNEFGGHDVQVKE
jgi:6-phosphogluconate dehydrogenase